METRTSSCDSNVATPTPQMLRKFSLSQDIFNRETPDIPVSVYTPHQLRPLAASAFIASIEETGHLGLAALYSGKNGTLAHLMVATKTQIILLVDIKVHCQTTDPSRKKPSGWKLLQDVLLSDKYPKYAFNMVRLMLALYRDHGLRLSRGIDLLSLHANRHSIDAFLEALGGKIYSDHIIPDQARDLIRALDEGQRVWKLNDASNRSLAMEAWAACHAATLPHICGASISTLFTDHLSDEELEMLATILRHQLLLTELQPLYTKNEVSPNMTEKDGKMKLMSERYKTRITRSSTKQYVEVTTIQVGGRTQVVKGRVTRVNGREATITCHTPSGSLQSQTINGFTTYGRDEPTQAEKLRYNIIQMILHGTSATHSNPFFKSIFLGSSYVEWADVNTYPSSDILGDLLERPLNSSQKEAVDTILSGDDRDRVAIIHGPPGTGKTTVIGAAVLALTRGNSERTMWLVAQSNVAVKNIAEKLVSMKFTDFKLLVSKEFHYDWHEDLYDAISSNLIRSDELAKDVVGVSRQLLGSRVMLCTLSMLSNMVLAPVIQVVPVETIIFDEASQIEIGNYLPPIHVFHSTLRKLVFIGDDKQLSPHGQSDIKDLRSVFEQRHLRDKAVFLDTQYRMPVPIGDFISENVYDGQLKTFHPIRTMESCQFINACGKEKRHGKSWINEREAQAVCKLAAMCEEKHLSYKVITPYDAQRGLLQKSLKHAKLNWEGRCYNVDSFQGNEDDYIIISLVRTEKLGFLDDIRRVNVMLTRCKRSMSICTNRAFIEDTAEDTLVGVMANEWAKEFNGDMWIEFEDLP